MAISSPKSHTKKGSQAQTENHVAALSSPLKSPNSPAPGIDGEPDNRKSCHQCRQKTLNLFASCKNTNKKKPCLVKFCNKCLSNRYGEKVSEVEALADWNCPKCRGICNCSVCMKKKGHQPTGILANTAKATGFSSVMEMLHLKSSKVSDAMQILKDTSTSFNKSTVSNEDMPTPKRKQGKENSPDKDLEKRIILLDHDNDKKAEFKMTAHKKLRLDKSNFTSTDLSCKEDGLSKKESKADVPKNGTDGAMNGDEKTFQVSVVASKKLSLGKDANSSALCSKDDILERKEPKMNVLTELNADSLKEANKMGKLLGCENIKKSEANPVDNFDHLIENHKKSLVGADVDFSLPKGNCFNNVAGIELLADDVGPALQFLEFCNAFQKVLHLTKGQAESVLREMMSGGGRVTRHKIVSSHIQFQIKLLTILQKDEGKVSPSLQSAKDNSWLKVLQECISGSQYAPKDFPVDSLSLGADGYEKIGSSEKLRVLNFLCTEALGTRDLRRFMDRQNEKYLEVKRAEKLKLQAAREKEKLVKQKLKDEAMQVILNSKEEAQFSIRKHDILMSTLKAELQKAHEMVEAIETAPDSLQKQRLDSLKTNLLFVDANDRRYWKLRDSSHESIVLVQELDNVDSTQDKWFSYDDDQEKALHEYISCKRKKKHWAKLINVSA